MRVVYHALFIRQLRKAPKKIQSATEIRIDLFISNPHHPILRNHRLTGSFQGCRSISITGDWRAIYYESDSILEESSIIFIELGTHSQLYQ